MSDSLKTTNGSPVEAAVSAATLDAPREKLNKKAITADQQVDRAVPCAMINNSPKAHHPLVTI
jgi:hypothetical protein